MFYYMLLFKQDHSLLGGTLFGQSHSLLRGTLFKQNHSLLNNKNPQPVREGGLSDQYDLG